MTALVTFLGCRLQFSRHQPMFHEDNAPDPDVCRFEIRMDDPADGRHVEVLLSKQDRAALREALDTYERLTK